MLILMSVNLIVKLVFELELSSFFLTLELRAFEHTIIVVCHELGFKELSDQFKGLGIKFSAQHDELAAIVFVE